MTKHRFHTFINFGAIGDRSKRAQLARSIYDGLRQKSDVPINLSNRDTDNFGTAINQIMAHEALQQLCAKDEGLAEQITQNILDFINATKRALHKTESPFAMEQQLVEEFEQIRAEAFEEVWEGVASFIQETYPRDELDPSFYTQEFRKSLSPQKRKRSKRIGFEGVKGHFTEKWRDILEQKQRDWEAEQIEEYRKDYCETLYQHIEEILALEELFNPYPGQPARLWDLSKSRLQRAHFEVLNRYAEFLRRDPSLQELAELLGKAQQTQAEFEEIPLEDRTLEPEWLATYTSKADLIGVHESDDISSILPSEAVLLAEETAQLLFYKKFAEKKLQTFAYQHKIYCSQMAGTQRTGWRRKETTKGPFILCIDTSGSMRGAPETIAKTLCFALLKIAIRDHRACYLISFAVGLETLNLSDLANALDTLIAFLSQSFYGGTNPMPALNEALNMLETAAYRKADLVMVSDFIMPPLDEQIQRRIKIAKEKETKLHGLLMGDQGSPEVNKGILEYFDTLWVYNLDLLDPY
jgi:uncharacterized protein with von Willebrand factor type A (vWA) domain